MDSMSDTIIIIVPTCSYTNYAEEALTTLKEFEADQEYYQEIRIHNCSSVVNIKLRLANLSIRTLILLAAEFLYPICTLQPQFLFCLATLRVRKNRFENHN